MPLRTHHVWGPMSSHLYRRCLLTGLMCKGEYEVLRFNERKLLETSFGIEVEHLVLCGVPPLLRQAPHIAPSMTPIARLLSLGPGRTAQCRLECPAHCD